MEFSKLKEFKSRAHEIAVRNNLFKGEQYDLLMIASEVIELSKALQKDYHADRITFERFKDADYRLYFHGRIKDTIEDEFADIILRSLSYWDEYLQEAQFEEYEIDWIEEDDIYMVLRYIAECVIAGNLNYVVLYTIALAKREDIDIEWHLDAKLKYNELRKWN